MEASTDRRSGLQATPTGCVLTFPAQRPAAAEPPQPGAAARRALRLIATLVTALLLPPFVVLAVAPMLLLLAPVALIGIPVLVPAMLSGSLAARSEDRQRASFAPPVPRRLRTVH